MKTEEIINRFTYHKPNKVSIEQHQEIRLKIIEISEFFNQLLPEGREKALVFTKLEETMFWANASIARNLLEIDE